jgi:hypothetical protein
LWARGEFVNLDPKTIELKTKEKKKEEPQEVSCPGTFDWDYTPEGEIWWEGVDYRIGTAEKPQTRSFLLEIKLTVTCGASAKSVFLYWNADVGWKDGKVQKSNERISSY